MYSAKLLDHFQNPRNAGVIERVKARARLENPACGDMLEISVRVDEKRIVDIGFRAKGCVPAMACGSAITVLARGKTLAEAREITREDVIEEVGGLPEASGHASHLAVDTLKEVVRKATGRGQQP
jgi:nitrogen fixation NifU-like protein